MFSIGLGDLRHQVTLKNPGPRVPDGEGGYTESQIELSPSPVWASIQPATARDLERRVASTMQASASHIVTMRYHPQVTTKTQLLFGDRVFFVNGVQNTDERNVELVLACQEIVQ